MDAVFVIIAEHFEVPGKIVGAHATQRGAIEQAVDCLNLMLADSPVGTAHPKATPDNWEAVVNALQEYHGAQYCYVEILERRLQT